MLLQRLVGAITEASKVALKANIGTRPTWNTS